MKTVEVAAGIVFRGGKLLITQRRLSDHLGGLWEFPGGKREPSESFEECLKRELREEIGVDVAVGSLVDEVDHTYPEKRVLLKFFRCKILRGEPRAIACPALAWIRFEDFSKYEFPAADHVLVEKLKQDRSFWK